MKSKTLFFLSIVYLIFSCSGKNSETYYSENLNLFVEKEFKKEPIRVFGQLNINVHFDSLDLFGFSVREIKSGPDNKEKIYYKHSPSEDFGSLMGIKFNEVRISTLNDSIYEIILSSNGLGIKNDFSYPYGYPSDDSIEEIVELFGKEYGNTYHDLPGFESSDIFKLWKFPDHTVTLKVRKSPTFLSIPKESIKDEYYKDLDSFYSKERSLSEFINFNQKADKKFKTDDFIKIEEFNELNHLEIIFTSSYFSTKKKLFQEEQDRTEAKKDSLLKEIEKQKIRN